MLNRVERTKKPSARGSYVLVWAFCLPLSDFWPKISWVARIKPIKTRAPESNAALPTLKLGGIAPRSLSCRQT